VVVVVLDLVVVDLLLVQAVQALLLLDIEQTKGKI
jgi:hypothetical protein